MTRPYRYQAGLRILVGMVSVAAVTVGCVSCSSAAKNTSSATTGSPSALKDLTGSQWVLDRATSSPRIAGTTPVTLTFTPDHTLSGAAPCNQYRGSFTLHEDSIRIGPLAQTLIACEPDLSAAEHAYTSALEAVRSVASGQDHLQLKGANGIALNYQGGKAAAS